jgi:hypothetical protein
MPNQRRSPPQRRRSRTSCMSPPVLIGALVVFLIGAYLGLLRPGLGDYVAREMVKNASIYHDTGEMREGMAVQVTQVLPDAIAALPSGQIRLPENQVNAYLQANPDALEPIEDVTVDFQPGRVMADLYAYGTRNRVTFGLDMEGDEMVAVNPSLEGPLSYMLSFGEFLDTMEDLINDQMEAQDRAILGVQIEEDEIILLIQ